MTPRGFGVEHEFSSVRPHEGEESEKPTKPKEAQKRKTIESLKREHELESLRPFSKDGFAVAEDKFGYFFMDRAGNRIGDEWYDWASDFEDGRAWIRIGDRISLIDTIGRRLNSIPISQRGPFVEGFALVNSPTGPGESPKNYFMDRNGDLLDPEGFDQADIFRDGIAHVMRRDRFGDEQWYWIDRDGNRVSSGAEKWNPEYE